MKCYEQSLSTLDLAVIYLRRAHAVLTRSNYHLKLTLALAVASKFNDDRYESKTIFHVIAQRDNLEFRQKMKEFLQSIDYRLFVNEFEISDLLSELYL
jgi:hypothetical protein